MSENYPVDPSDLRARGTKGVMSTAGGVGLLVVNSILHLPLLGGIISGALVVVGLGALFGRSKTDKVAGGIALLAGMAGLSTVLYKLPVLGGVLGSIGGFASFVIGAGAVVLLGIGGWNIYKFVKGLRSRA
jgi:hypothetical protein